MTLPVFPQGRPPDAPYAWGLDRPIASGGPSWSPKTRRLTRRELAAVELSFRYLDWTTEALPLIAFWNTVDGGNGLFTFIDFHANDDGTKLVWPSLYIATGDGVTTNFDMPTSGCIAGTVQKNGSNLTTHFVTSLPGSPTAGHAYVVYSAAGTALDSLHYQAAASTSDRFTIVDAQCLRAMPKARFGVQKLPLNTDDPLNISIGPLPIFEVV